MGDKVWVVSEYELNTSECRVLGIYSSLQLANECADVVRGVVTELPLDPSRYELELGLKIFYVKMNRDGTKAECRSDDRCFRSLPIKEEEKKWFSGFEGKFMSSNVWAKDASQAVALVDEMRLELIASEKKEDDNG